MPDKRDYDRAGSDLRYRAHPWHGVYLGDNWPGVFNA